MKFIFMRELIHNSICPCDGFSVLPFRFLITGFLSSQFKEDITMLFRKPIPTLALFVMALVLPTLSFAGSATISWRANAESDLAGYRLYYGTSSRSYGPPVPAGRVTQYTLANLTDGRTYYFGVTALDFSGNESGYSAEAKKTIATSTGSNTGTAIISNLSVASGKAYQILTGLSNNLLCYIDRTYKYSNVPSFMNGATFIKTANDDKKRTDTNFLTFTANYNVKVYVAYDNRNAKPAWLSTYTDTKADLTTDTGFSIYQKNFSAGKITLGGNVSGGSMYTVMIIKN